MAGKLAGGPARGKVSTTEQNSDINVTPFVDVMLVLLIIFMVAAPLATASIRLDLPPAVPPPPGTPEKDPVFITIQETGSIFVVDSQSSIETLIGDLTAAVGGSAPSQERVFVRAQPDVPYESFMEVMNTLQGAGWYKVGLLNEDIE